MASLVEFCEDMDFTLIKYQELLVALKKSGIPFKLRHDVDMLPHNSLRTAQIEKTQGLYATYYFRMVPESYDEDVIKSISGLGHEIGYHYESLTTCNGDMEAAYNDFCRNLDKLRTLVPISSICMHGSPRSRYDGKDLWKKYDYHDFGIIGEPYFDVDFSKLFYLTDTGRCWDGFNVSVRDKIPVHQDRWIGNGWVYHTTDDVIGAIDNKGLPEQIMITTHPQRWTDNFFQWTKELLVQNAKNVVKQVIVLRQKSK